MNDYEESEMFDLRNDLAEARADADALASAIRNNKGMRQQKAALAAHDALVAKR
jgi:hypothetical protein